MLRFIHPLMQTREKQNQADTFNMTRNSHLNGISESPCIINTSPVHSIKKTAAAGYIAAHRKRIGKRPNETKAGCRDLSKIHK